MQLISTVVNIWDIATRKSNTERSWNSFFEKSVWRSIHDRETHSYSKYFKTILNVFKGLFENDFNYGLYSTLHKLIGWNVLLMTWYLLLLTSFNKEIQAMQHWWKLWVYRQRGLLC